MTYYGDYGFDDFLKQGAKNDSDLLQFVKNRLLGKNDIEISVDNMGCTAFSSMGKNGGILYGRNYDFPYCPSIVVKTKPKNGYASISVSDMTPLGYGKNNLPKGIRGKLPLLALPYTPFDGMNEKGLAIAILKVAKTELPNDPDKITLNTTTMIRLVLDKAATVDEAVALFQNYNMYFSGDIYCHYLITERSGKSAIVEYWEGKMHVVEENIASNFHAHNRYSEVYATCAHSRYDKVKTTINELGRKLDIIEASKLLCNVGCYTKDGDCMLQWSVVYDLSALEGMIFPHRDMSKPYRFRL